MVFARTTHVIQLRRRFEHEAGWAGSATVLYTLYPFPVGLGHPHRYAVLLNAAALGNRIKGCRVEYRLSLSTSCRAFRFSTLTTSGP